MASPHEVLNIIILLTRQLFHERLKKHCTALLSHNATKLYWIRDERLHCIWNGGYNGSFNEPPAVSLTSCF